MFKYAIGETVRIKEGMYAGKTFTIGEDDRESSGGHNQVPMYHYERHGRWYFEDDLEPVSLAPIVKSE